MKNASRYLLQYRPSRSLLRKLSPVTDFPGFALQAPKKELRTIRYNGICEHFIQFSVLRCNEISNVILVVLMAYRVVATCQHPKVVVLWVSRTALFRVGLWNLG